MIIRTATPQDYPEIAALVRTAFTDSELGYHDEATLVAKIRAEKNFDAALEIVATKNKKIVGHGLLSQVSIATTTGAYAGLVLAPLAILPGYQSQGFGTALIAELEQRARQKNCPYISILGHPHYYAKFGYVPAESHFGVTPPMPVSAEVFLIKPLFPAALNNKGGVLHYSVAFA